MTFIVQCPSCGSRLKANENLVGRQIACPKCRRPVIVAAPTKPSPPVPMAQYVPTAQPVPGYTAPPPVDWGSPGAVPASSFADLQSDDPTPEPRRFRGGRQNSSGTALAVGGALGALM